MDKILGLKALREDVEGYAKEVEKGKSFVVVRRSKPLFKIVPVDEDGGQWETISDFTKAKKKGVSLQEVLDRI